MTQEALLTIGVGVASLAVYLRTMCRTIYVGDSGELAAAVHVLGIPHPPGYPLYILLGKLFSVLFPIGCPALRLNVFSAVCAAVSVSFANLTLLALGLDPWVAAGASLAWGMSASLWSQSGIPRVYALGACLSFIATYASVRWYAQPGDADWLCWAAFVVGLALANHTVAVAHIPAIAALVVLREPAVFGDALLLLKLAACALPGPLLYITWIPWRSRRQPPVNWGNIRSFEDLRRFLGRKEYWQHRYVRSWGQLVEAVSFYVRRTQAEYGWLGCAAIVIGIPLSIRQAPGVASMAGVLVVVNALSMVLHARREDIFHWTRYMITAWGALAIPLAFGWQLMLSAFPLRSQPAVAMLPAVVLLLAQFRQRDLSRHRYAEEYNRRILESLPPDATLIAQDDNVVFPLMYLKYAEGLRPDVKLLEQGVHRLAEFRFNPRHDAVYCTHWQAAFSRPPTAQGPGLRLISEGLVYRIVSTDMDYRPRDLWESHLLPDMEDPRIPRNYLTRCLLGNVYFMRAEWALPSDAVEAMAWYDRAARMAWDNAVLHYNLGLSFERAGWRRLSADAFQRAAQIDPKYARPTS